jgi:hypothetical protein
VECITGKMFCLTYFNCYTIIVKKIPWIMRKMIFFAIENYG